MRPGDDVVSLPSRTASRVASIDTFDGPLEEAFSPQSVALTLEDDVDVSRGDVIVRPNNQPRVVSSCEAMVIWFNESVMSVGTPYVFLHTTRRVNGTIAGLRYLLNVDSLHQEPSDELRMNEIGRCRLEFSSPLVEDPYTRNRNTGSLVIVDRISNETLGAAVIVDRRPGAQNVAIDGSVSETLRYEQSAVSLAQRQKRLKQRPVTLLLTGLTGSGKSTVASALEERLFGAGHAAVVLDGENLRLGLTRDLGFTPEDRVENVRRTMEVAKILNDAGQIAICALIAPSRAMRSQARDTVGSERFVLVHLNIPLEICKRRHDKGLYEAAESGHHRDIPGQTSTYEVPLDAALTLDERDDIESSVDKIMELLVRNSFLNP